MSPAKLSSKDRAGVQQKLIGEMQDAHNVYRAKVRQYSNANNDAPSAARDLEAWQAIYQAAKELRMARKRYRRAVRVLAGFAA